MSMKPNIKQSVCVVLFRPGNTSCSNANTCRQPLRSAIRPYALYSLAQMPVPALLLYISRFLVSTIGLDGKNSPRCRPTWFLHCHCQADLDVNHKCWLSLHGSCSMVHSSLPLPGMLACSHVGPTTGIRGVIASSYAAFRRFGVTEKIETAAFLVGNSFIGTLQNIFDRIAFELVQMKYRRV